MAKVRHGHAVANRKTSAYSVWSSMRRRCENPNNTRYANYGGRGITVCGRWAIFENFLEDMGEPPPGLTLDRIDNNGNYDPKNCRWATRREQSHNSSNVKIITHDGKTLCIRDWERSLGLSAGALWHRLKNGWPLAKALTRARQS